MTSHELKSVEMGFKRRFKRSHWNSKPYILGRVVPKLRGPETEVSFRFKPWLQDDQKDPTSQDWGDVMSPEAYLQVSELVGGGRVTCVRMEGITVVKWWKNECIFPGDSMGVILRWFLFEGSRTGQLYWYVVRKLKTVDSQADRGQRWFSRDWSLCGGLNSIISNFELLRWRKFRAIPQLKLLRQGGRRKRVHRE